MLAHPHTSAGRGPTDAGYRHYADIILRDTVRIGDVANVYFGPADAESLTRLNGRPVIGLGVVK